MSELQAPYLTEGQFYHTNKSTYQFLFSVTYEYSTLAILQDINTRMRIAVEMDIFVELIEQGVYRLEQNVR